MSKLFPTTLVGSYPQPDWLIDREQLAGHPPPRVRARGLWRIGPEWLDQAQDDATILAIRDQERAGLDIITDGEIRRALPFVGPERLIVAPDCGMKYLPREVAFAKMKAMADGAAIVRRELSARATAT